MIQNPSRDELVALIGNEFGVCVSLLMRTHESGRDTKQNSIRFKNLITTAIKKIGDRSGRLTVDSSG